VWLMAAVKQRSIERVGGRDHDASIFELLDDVVIGADWGVVMITPLMVGSLTDLIQDLDHRAGCRPSGASDPSLIRLIPKALAATCAPTRQDRRSRCLQCGNDCEVSGLPSFLCSPLFRSVLPTYSRDALLIAPD